ncbi:GNAT family N-acetyltransferase [Agriterribacter sp.]|uniref:GNAT family N-acetyltransferase n=1 Tax=Agriterribacter sp. TaxID=2821509 RepID=UPI002BEB96C7|nr:GNAT family N-acetyltransferase [Agriterribacter sp.]HTN09080.1 GNAT family N-acetyltransferase [Agriterribacter sp.]
MNDVKLKLDEKGHGHFYISDGEEQVAEMVVSVAHGMLTVYHTEVLPKGEGKGLAKQLLAAMVDHARKNQLKVIPLCPYVHAQFKRHHDEYADVWYKSDQ